MSENAPGGFSSITDPCWTAADFIRLAGRGAPPVRYWALRRLDDLDLEIPVEVLRGCLEDADDILSGAAAVLIGKRGVSALADALLDRLRRGEGTFGSPYAMALADLGDRRVLKFLRSRCKGGPLRCDPGVWIALSSLKGPEAIRLLREAFEQLPLRGAARVALLLAGAFVQSDPQEALPLVADRWLESPDGEEADALLAALLPAAEFDGGVQELRESLNPDRESSWPGLHEAMLGMLSELVPLRLTSEASRAGRKSNWVRLIEALAPIAAWLEAEAKTRAATAPSLALVRTLGARSKRLGGAPDRAREASALMLLDLVRISRAEKEPGVTLPGSPEDRFDWLLSDAAEAAPETAGSVFDQLAAEAPRDAWTAACLRTIELKGSQATIAVELLGAWRSAAGAAALARLLGDQENPDLAEAATDALAEIGEAAVNAVVDRLGSTEEPVLLEDCLNACIRLPSRRIVAAICRRFEELWIHAPEPLLHALEILGAREFIEPLGRELREGEAAAERAFALLCQLNEVSDARAEDIRRRLAEREQEMEAARDSGQEPDASLELPLTCNGCRRTYTYTVREILVDPETQEEEGFQPFIMDTIRCKGCGRENDHSLPERAQLLLMSELALLMERSEQEGVEVLQEGPFRFVRMGLSDGRRLHPREARQDYETRLASRPDDPDLLIGYANVLRLLGEVEKSETALRRALELDPAAADAYATLGQFAEERGDLAAAEEMYRRVVALGRKARFYRVKARGEFLGWVEEALVRVQGARAAHPPEPVSARARLEALTAQDHARAKIGRNDPCPCGSGKKYKKCCLSKDERAPEERAPAGPDGRLRQRLMAYAETSIPRAEAHRATREFFGEQFDPDRKRLALDLRGVEADGPAFLEWLIHDFSLSTGGPVIARFLKERGHTLPGDERAILEEWQDAAVGLHEVLDLDPGRSLTLRDVFTGETRTVREVRGSLSAARWDLLGARVIRVKGEPFLSGTITLFHPRDREGLVSHVTERYQAFCRDHPGVSWRDFFRAESLIFRRYAQRLAQEEVRPPKVHTPEGHPVMLGRLRYEVRDPHRLLQAMAAAPDFEETTGPDGPASARQFAWIRIGPAERYVTQAPLPAEGLSLSTQRLDADGKAGIPGLASLTLDGNDLAVETMSSERLAWAKARLAELAGDAIRLRADVIEDPMEKLRTMPEGRRGREASSEIPPEVQTRLMGQMLHRHFTAWLDQEIPALDGRTPRQAARDVLLRPKLIQLLREIENIQDRERQQGKPWYDAAWMWETLGIRRTEA